MAQLQFNRQILDKLVYPIVRKSGESLQHVVRPHQSTNSVLHVGPIGESLAHQKETSRCLVHCLDGVELWTLPALR